MKMTTLKSVAIAAGVLGLALPAFGQATSEVVGYYTVDLIPGFNLLGVSLHNQPLASGTFESDLTDADATFTTTLTGGGTFLVEIEDGTQAGAVAEVDSFTDTTLTVSGGLATGAAGYAVREAMTLEDLFGTSLTGSFNASAADIVYVPDGSGGYTQYFYSTTGSQFRPTTAPFAVAASVPVFYPDGVLVQVKTGSPSVTVAGDLKTSPTAVSNLQGFNVVSNPGPVGVTLGDLGLPQLTGSFNASAADIVWLPDGAGGFVQYFYSTTASAWRLTTSPFAGNENGTSVPSAFFIQRKTPGTTAVANVPSFYAGL